MAIDEGNGFATVIYKNTGPYFAANPRQRITERSEVTLENAGSDRSQWARARVV